MKDIFLLPNQITIVRVLLIPIFIYFLISELPYKDYIAAFVFIILSLSDALDGYIARKTRQITSIGKIIDPIADKLLIAAALIFLIGKIQLWMAIVIIMRELIVTAARIFFLPKKVISASYLGKIKTISQIIAILAVILNAPFNWWLMLIAVIITVISGIDYLIKMGKLLEENIFNIPNMITTFRFLLMPLFIVNVVKSNTNLSLIIITFFIFLDKFDGLSAKISKKITKFGRIYDAFTDYTLVLSSYMVFYISDVLSLIWIMLLILPFIFIIISNLLYYAKYKETIPSFIGKIVMGTSYILIVAIIIDFVYKVYILAIVLILGYIYMIVDIYTLIWKEKKKRIHKLLT